MSVESNKKLIEKYFETINRGDEQEILALLSDDFQFESMLQAPKQFNFTWGREPFAAAPKNMSAMMHKPIKIWIEGMIGEGDKVAVEAKSHGEMKSGKLYQNVYHFLFTVRDGKITNAREYSCSYTANDCFGGFSDGNFD